MGGFSNPIIGGAGALVYPSIHSPNFVQGTSGWSIDKDGNAYFTGVTLTGGSLIVESPDEGVFVYSGTPTLGNLVISIANAAGTDPYGNVYPAGLNVVNGMVTVQDPAYLQFPSGQTYENTSAKFTSSAEGTSPAQYLSMGLTGPSVTGSHDQILVAINSAANNGSSSANLDFLYKSVSGTYYEYAYMDDTGFNIPAGTITAPAPGSSPAISASWQQMSLTSGWTAGTNNGYTDAPSYSVLPCSPYLSDGAAKCVAFRGTLVTPSTGTVTDVTFTTVPSGYSPQTGPFSRINGLINNGGTQSGRIEIHPNGNLQLTGSFGNSAAIDITGITFI